MAWNHPIEKPVEPKKAPSRARGALAGVVVVAVLGVAAYFIFCSDGGRSVDDGAGRDRGKIKEVKPAKVRSAESEVRSARKEKPKTVEEIVASLDDKPKPTIKVRQLSPEEWDRLTNRTFKTGTEQLMSWVFSVQPGDMPIPIPSIGEEDRKNLAAILISKNPISEKDDERTAFCKEQVDFAKKEMAKYIGDGGDPDDFLQYYFQELKLAFDKRNDAISQLQETNEDDPELAEQLREEINKKFEEEGIKKIIKEEI